MRSTPLLEAGQTLRALAAQYGLSDSALDRHARLHLFAEADAGAEAAHNNRGTRNGVSMRAQEPEKKRSILARLPAPVWAFAGGYLMCLLQRNAGLAQTEAGAILERLDADESCTRTSSVLVTARQN